MTERRIREVVLVGNPNTGKTTIFNALTGLRHTTGNYPGVTVEKRAGGMNLPGGEEISVIDLPGAYSLQPRSPDEDVVHDVLLGAQKGTPLPDLVLVVLAANNLERNLYLATQVASLNLPVIFVINMWDIAQETGITIDLARLEAMTGIRCVPAAGMKGDYIRRLKRVMREELNRKGGQTPFLRSPETVSDPLAVDPAVRYRMIENIMQACVRREGKRSLGVFEFLTAF